MHKSKYFDMAVDMASSKLVPKPNVQVKISMQKGGGLSGIGEKIVYRQDGGTPNLNKSINIHGQPHSLAWINPDEAATLKAMGGSGKKVEGIPAYYYGTFGSEIDLDTGIVKDVDYPDLGDVDSKAVDLRSGMSAAAHDPAKDKSEMELGNIVSWGLLGYEGYMQRPEVKKALKGMQDITGGRQGGNNPWNPYGIKDEYNTPKRRRTIQMLIDTGKLQGIGIEFANSWESEGLNTFGKNMRGPFEAWTPGKGLSRDSYDPGVLIGTAQFTDDYWKRKQGLASEEFVMRLQNAKPGETVSDISAQYKEEFGEDPPIDAFGYNVNSTALASQVAESLNDARTSGAFQGATLMAGFGPGTLAQLVTTRYITNPENEKSSVTDALKDITSKGINIIKNTVPKSWTATNIATGESVLDIAQSTVKKGLGILDLVTSPVSTISKWGLEKASEMFVPKSVLDATPKQIEVEKEKEPTITDTIKDTLSLNIGKRPLPSADIYEGENITEAVQSPSIEIASLPVAPEEDIANIYGEMSGYFSQPKPPRKNVFTDALLENIYQV